MNYMDNPGCVHSFVTVQIISAFLSLDFTGPRRQQEHFSKAVPGLRRAVVEKWVGGSWRISVESLKRSELPPKCHFCQLLCFPEIGGRSS